MLNEPRAHSERRQFIVSRSTPRPASAVLFNLLRDTSPSALAFLAEQYGLRRLPGLNRQALVARVMNHLTPQQLANLRDDLIAARFGALSVEGLVMLALVHDRQRNARPSPRLDKISRDSATLIEGSTTHWVYTMRGHDVLIDSARRVLACDCGYFRFAARRMALCKHLAMAFQLMPEVYAREVLIDLLVSREYGGPDTPHWRFIPIRRSKS